MDLQGKGILVTGGSSGIGKGVALRFAQSGARLFISGAEADADDLNTTIVELRDLGADTAGVTADVADESSVGELVDAAIAHLGRIDVLVSNAGVYWPESFLDITVKHWQRMLGINLTGMFLVGQRVARHMAATGGGGAIINTASTNGFLGDEDCAHYNASKGGLIALTKAMATDLAPHGIRVNCVCPGMIVTRMSGNMSDDPNIVDVYAKRIPMDRFGSTDEVSHIYAFLASDGAAYITGAVMVVDGGLTAGLRWRGWIS